MLNFDLSALLGQQAQPAPLEVFLKLLCFDSEKDPDTGIYSNAYPCRLVSTGSGRVFYTVEQYLAWKIAYLMGDKETAEEIISIVWDCTPDGLGQINWESCDRSRQELFRVQGKIKNFDVGVWNEMRLPIMRQALTYKFCQVDALYKSLIEERDHFFVYANPGDRMWGIGLTADVAVHTPHSQWGSNDLGALLVAIRDELIATGKPEWAVVQSTPVAVNSDHRAVAEVVVNAMKEEEAPVDLSKLIPDEPIVTEPVPEKPAE